MTRRYREPVDVETVDGRPWCLRWRDRQLTVVAVSGCWRDDPGWWTSGPAAAVAAPQRELWRLEARPDGGGATLLCELANHGDRWTLERVYD